MEHKSKLKVRTFIIFQIATVLFTGLLAGLFYGYECSVNKALSNLSNEGYLEAFQSINKTIQNPVFFLSFIGSFFLLIITTVWSFKSGETTSSYLLLSALLIYLVGVFGITIWGNVPLNEQLAKFSISTSSADAITLMRKAFEKPWNTFHTTRTFASILSFCLTILSLIKK